MTYREPYNGLPPYQPGSETSKAAAIAIAPSAATRRAQVLEFLRERGESGATNDEIVCRLGMMIQTVTARMRELVLRGAVVDSGERRLTRTGRPAVVWIAKESEGTSVSPAIHPQAG
ncbi:hypothetical protein D3C72_561650 [compost metagenome]